MASAILAFFVSALTLQMLSAQCMVHPGIYANNYAAEAPLANNVVYGVPCGPYGMVPEPFIPENGAVFNGGGFKVTSYSSVGPTGVRVHSDDLIVEGPLSVNGKLPFLGVVTVEGPLPAIGEGAVAYGCGNGNIGIVTEGVPNNGLGVAAGLTGLGYNGLPNGMGVHPLY